MEQGCTSSRFASLIDKLLVHDLSPTKMSELRGHLASCEACQHRYNRVVLASRLLDGGPDALELPSDRELGWVGQAVLERARLVPDSAPARRSVLRWVVAAATAAVVVAIALPLALRTSGPPSSQGPRPGPGVAHTEEFQARGAPAQPSQKVGLRAFCIHRQARDAQAPLVFEAASVQSATTPACQVSDVMRFAYTNRSKMAHLFLVGIDEKYRIKWYEPHPPRMTSIPVRAEVVDEPLSRAVRLKVNHAQGKVRLFAIFSPEPLHAAQVKQAVAKVKEADTPLGRLQVLPLENTEQRSVLVTLSR